MPLQTRLDGNVIESGSIPVTAISNFTGQLTASLPTGTVSSSAQVQLSGITGTTFSNNNFTFPQTVNVTGGVTASAGFFGTASYATTANFALTPAGSSGTSGTGGSAGSAGTSGSTGTSGSSGSAGSAGTAGSSGTSGTRGSSGSSGSSGSTGTSGSTGSSGATGASGSSGSTGTSGSSGATGASGSSGSAGTAGSSGTSGTRGSSGSSGTTGANGSSGTSGATGANGSSGSSGTSASVTINNNTDNYVVTATGTTNTLNGESALTFNGSKLSLSGTTNGSTPVFDITASGTDAFSRGVRMINSSMINGSSLMYAVGQADSARNMGQFYFVYSSAGSTTNRLSMGLHSVDDVFNILGSGNVGIGTTSPVSLLNIFGGAANWNETTPGQSTGTIHLAPTNTANFGNAITFGASDTAGGANAQAGIYVRSSGGYGTKMYFATTDNYSVGAYTRMYISEAGSVGIGTTSPRSRLEVNGNIYQTWGSGGFIGMVYSDGTAYRNGILTADNTRSTGLVARYADNSGYVWFGVGSAEQEKMRITNSGNVGIGTTSPGEKLTVIGNISATDNDMFNYKAQRVPIEGNPQNGTYKGYILLAKAYTSGAVNPSYVIGKIIMRRGTTSTGHNLDVYEVVSSTGYQGERFIVNAIGAGSDGSQFVQNGGRLVKVTYGGVVYHAIESSNSGGQPSTEMFFEGAVVDSPLKMTDGSYVSSITAYGTVGIVVDGYNNGNVGIGIANPGYKLQVVGGSIVNSTSVGGTGDPGISLGDGHRLGFDQSGTRSWTIKPTGGNLQFFSGDNNGYHVFSSAGVGIGTTSPSAKLDVTSTTATGTAPTVFLNQNSAYGSIFALDQYHGLVLRGYPTANSTYAMTGADVMSFMEYGGVFRFYLKNNSSLTLQGELNNGKLTVSGDVVAYGTPSDITYKHDVQQLTNALGTVQKLRGVSFKWNKDTDSHAMVNITDDLGFIAQEVREVLPTIVRENENGKLSLRDKAIIPLLVEAIKEQQHTIQSLQNRIETLEKK